MGRRLRSRILRKLPLERVRIFLRAKNKNTPGKQEHKSLESVLSTAADALACKGSRHVHDRRAG